jgi:hypothetical protein
MYTHVLSLYIYIYVYIYDYRFEGKVNSLTIGKIELERTPEDTQIDEISHYILQLGIHICLGIYVCI